MIHLYLSCSGFKMVVFMWLETMVLYNRLLFLSTQQVRIGKQAPNFWFGSFPRQLNEAANCYYIVLVALTCKGINLFETEIKNNPNMLFLYISLSWTFYIAMILSTDRKRYTIEPISLQEQVRALANSVCSSSFLLHR